MARQRPVDLLVDLWYDCFPAATWGFFDSLEALLVLRSLMVGGPVLSTER